jgi:hypothetical protein
MSETRASRNEEEGGHTAGQTPPVCCTVLELRQYTLKPERRDELIALFERHFLEGQEQYGMQILGQFRHRSNPDLFVWLRGFSDMQARQQTLQGFYGGPIWQAHSSAANATMLDSDNVLLLKPVHPTSGVRGDSSTRPAMDAQEGTGGMVIATIYAFDEPVDAHFIEFFEGQMVPLLSAAGAVLLGYYVTEPAQNTFPALPVREGEHVFVWFASFADEEAYATYRTAFSANEARIISLAPTSQGWPVKQEEVLELLPTRRSFLRHRLE